MHFWRGVGVVVAVVTLTVGCAPAKTGSEGVRALETGEPASRGTAPAPPDAPDRTASPRPTIPAEAPSPSTAASPDAEPADPDGSDRRTVQQVLDRYDRAVTALNADPSAIMRPGDALVADLDAVVPAATVLASDVRSAVADRLAAGEQVRRPGRGSPSWVHHATAITDPGDSSGSGEIAFDWCSWSPGVAVDAASGAVTDDGVGQATGSGTVILAGSTWVLTSLDQMSLEVLPAGSPDPCPGAAR